MNTERLARGWSLIAEGAQEIALAYESIQQPGSGAGVPPPARASAPADDLPPLTDEDAPRAAEPPSTALGACPAHRTAWTVKAGGISKNGKPYNAFWKCSGKNDDGTYCKEKPVKAWADSHPITLDVAA